MLPTLPFFHNIKVIIQNARFSETGVLLFSCQKHYVHNISVVHIDGGEGGIRAPVTPAYSLSRGGEGGYLPGENGDVYVVGV